ncbi:MAG: tRNA (adenosine(37)-N6)-threonylcarbamoyltransferase complex transferase subunit TsaD [Polyangiaceae bacterium]|nr:tRNA (adenosine(37)-N6)-threonylcarbamoyltransferase complex transferase subunit TsaD [Polyangiaceae bacterium]
MLVLGIETSCDETAAAVVDSDGHVLADVVHSQVALHAPYGGIVPELASRDHLRNLRPVVEAALERASLGIGDIGGIAVTARPGLSGALLVGTGFARGLAYSRGLPVVGVDHLVGHLLAAFLRYDDVASAPPEFPFVALLASGGHTALYRVDGLELSQVQELGATRDDAAGEAFDKVGKLLGLGYPGGPVIDRLAREGDPSAIPLARPMKQSRSLEFSFSGLKTQVMRWVAENGAPKDDQTLRDLCASFQRVVVDSLVKKAVTAATGERVGTLVLAGGVAANSGLRQHAREAAERASLALVVPPLRACTDNAAMIAFAGSTRLARGEDDRFTLETSPHTALLQVTRKGRGRR